MNAFSYDYPKSIEIIIQDAKPVNPGWHGHSSEGHHTLLKGTAGRFVVHIRQDREMPVPEARVLTLPDHVSDTDAIQYARSHPDAFTPWQAMICPDSGS